MQSISQAPKEKPLCVQCGMRVALPHVCTVDPKEALDKVFAAMLNTLQRAVVEVTLARKEAVMGVFSEASARIDSLEELFVHVEAGRYKIAGMMEARASTGLVGTDGNLIKTDR